MKLDRSNKEKPLSSHYYDHLNLFFSMYWNKDFIKLKDEEFYIQLKPKMKIEVDEICFEPIYSNFSGFFKDLEKGFWRALVHNLVFEDYRYFPPYTDIYKENRRYFPLKQSNILLEQNKIPDKIFFITSGEAYAGNIKGRYVYFRLPDGSYFGDSHVLAGLPLSYSIFFDETVGCSALTIHTKVFFYKDMQINFQIHSSELKIKQRNVEKFSDNINMRHLKK